MATRKPQTQRAKLAVAFRSGYDFTTNQIASRLKVSNSRARFLVTELRQDGYAIYKNRKQFNDGKTAAVYHLGIPSRKMIAIAAKYGPSDLFNDPTLLSE